MLLQHQQSILQVCRLTPPWGVDLFKLISLAYQAHTVTTVFLSGKADGEFRKHYHGKVIFFEINHKKPFWRFKAAIKLWRLCHSQHFDQVICHHYKPTVIMDWVSYFYPRKKYFSVHHTEGNLRRFGRKLYTRLSLRRRWKFIAVSQCIKQDLKGAKAGILDDQFRVIYNAIMLEEIVAQQLTRENARERLGLHSQQFVFGTIGRLVASKGHFGLIDAFSKVRRQCPHGVLVILGAGPLESALHAHVKALKLSHCVLIPSNEASYAGCLIQAFDIFVFPSLREGFGLVLLEAMAAKLPIIASNKSGIPEVIGETGILVPSEEEALTQALLKLYRCSAKERLALGEAGYHRLCQYFLLSHFREAWEGVLEMRKDPF